MNLSWEVDIVCFGAVEKDSISIGVNFSIYLLSLPILKFVCWNICAIYSLSRALFADGERYSDFSVCSLGAGLCMVLITY